MNDPDISPGYRPDKDDDPTDQALRHDQRDEPTDQSLRFAEAPTNVSAAPDNTEPSLPPTGLIDCPLSDKSADSVTGTEGDGTEKSLPKPENPRPAGDDPTDQSLYQQPSSKTDDSTERSLAPGTREAGGRKPNVTPKASSNTDLIPLRHETNNAGALAEEETFIPDASLAPPGLTRPPQGFPEVPGFDILGTLGRGGMGVVYKARQKDLRRIVALKMILHGDHASASDLVRFRTEAEAIARLQHVNIVQIYAIDEYKGLPYFSLEYVAGGTLSRKIDGMPQPVHKAAQLIETLARAIAAAHQRGIIHRDLKPGNVLLTEDGTPKIVDFGLAKKLDEISDQTHSGAVMGTPSYMSPEQADGLNDQIGPATDIYALGALLYETLTGRPPFRAEKPMDTLLMVIHDEPVRPSLMNPKVPRDLETICLKCLQKEIAKRYATAMELAEDLRRFQDGDPILARPVTRWERAVKWVRRRPALAAVYGLLLAVGVLGSIGGIITFLWFEADAAHQLEKEAKARIEKSLAREVAALKGEELAKEELARQEYVHRINLAWLLWNGGDVVDIARARKLVDSCPESRRRWEWHFLQHQVNPELLTVPTGDDEPRLVQLAPDGKSLLVLGKDGKPYVWDALTGQKLLAAPADAEIAFIALGPSDKLFAVAGADHVITIRDGQTHKVLHTLKGHQGALTHLAFSPDGARLASASADKTAKVWDVATGKEWRSLAGHDAPVARLSFSPNGRRLATASWDSTAKIWDLEKGEELGTLAGHAQALTEVVFSPDGKRLATVCMDKTVKLWDHATFLEAPPVHGPMEDVNHVAFSPDGGRIAFAKRDKTIKVFDLVSGKQLFFLQGHNAEVTKVSYSPEGERLVTTSKDRTVKIWDATTGKDVLTLPGTIDNIGCMAYNPARPREAAVCQDNVARLWDTGAGKELAELRGHTDRITRLVFAPDGDRLATLSRDGTARVWDPAAGKTLTLKGHTGDVTKAAFSPDGTRLATAGLDQTVILWDARSGQRLWTYKQLPGEPLQLAFRPDGKHLAVVARSPGVIVLDAADGTPLFNLQNGPEDAVYLAYDLASTTIATSALDSNVRLWDAATGKLRVTFSGHDGKVEHLAFRHDGGLLASASWDKTVKVWDCAAHKLLYTLAGHDGEVVHTAFSSHGDRLLSGSFDGRVRVWDMATGKELLLLEVGPLGAPGNEIVSVHFSPDGRQVAATTNSFVKVWNSQAQTPDVLRERRRLWREEQAHEAERHGQWFAAAFHLSRLLEGGGKKGPLLGRRGAAMAEQNLWDQALVDLSAASTLAPGNSAALDRLGLAHLGKGDDAGYRRLRDRLLRELPALTKVSALAKTGHHREALRTTARLAVLTPMLPPDAAVVLAALKTLGPADDPDILFLSGAAAYRTGNHGAALEPLRKAAEADSHVVVEARLFLAMTYHHLKNAEQARRTLAQAAEQIERDALNLDEAAGARPSSWEVRVRRSVLRHEAEALIEK